MTDPAERLVNLALFLAAAPEPVTAARVRAQVAGYPADQNEAAFLRMFERDKEDLLAAGIAFEVVRTGETEAYLLDRAATFAGELRLDPESALLVRVAAEAMLGDPSFPFAADLRPALAKLSAAAGDAPAGPAPVVALTADEAPDEQARVVGELAQAIGARKRVSFRYTNASGAVADRDVEPFGIFAKDGRWYLVGRDAVADGMRVFAVARMAEPAVNPARPKSPDFETPAGFDIGEWMLLPFQFGDDRFPAVLRLDGPAASRAEALSEGRGELVPAGDGSVVWRVEAANAAALATWAIENGPGIRVVEPAPARKAFADGLRRVVAHHAG